MRRDLIRTAICCLVAVALAAATGCKKNGTDGGSTDGGSTDGGTTTDGGGPGTDSGAATDGGGVTDSGTGNCVTLDTSSPTSSGHRLLLLSSILR